MARGPWPVARGPWPVAGFLGWVAVTGQHDEGEQVPPPLPQAEYEAIYARVPRLTVEVVAVSDAGVLLARRSSGPCRDLWNLPGGTVRYGERLLDAVHRVALDEIGVDVEVDQLLGYLEYPSHLEQGIDWPIGIAFQVSLTSEARRRVRLGAETLAWFATAPDQMHWEQREFLRTHGLTT